MFDTIIVADCEYTAVGILHMIEVDDFHCDPSHDVPPILILAVSSFDPKSSPNIDNEMEPEDGPLCSFKWDTVAPPRPPPPPPPPRASQNVTIKTTDTQNCGFRAINKDSRITTIVAVLFVYSARCLSYLEGIPAKVHP